MHTVCQLKAFYRVALAAGVSDEDIGNLVTYLAKHPDAGVELKGTGGCRKVRFAIRGNNKGKSGGGRTITLFSGEDLPLFLITVFAKSQRITLTKAECNKLRILSEDIVQEYARRVTPIAAGEGS
ncbi:type II toxin-antitoxin system RelE/ParE family toxin [Breoghania sp.]|uniref:type II toxin-antitoxin system RelE/ParE family toxin n=1 Tax=Breoghania sp. TaxID=2065378 RepID=UPI00261B86D9|nr:type II toxin-antitoxin system RelE/ParE family toxin [Breoghania sp.]MDJ0932947.1 type II toxin-antitoxin system RelE/ParE family toxin [Breoghania sp.]